jgi:hypothetical protein
MSAWANDPGHVVEAILAIEAMRPQPRFVVHLGCGDNALVSALRRRRCDGLGIDPASAAADMQGPSATRPGERIPVGDGVADCVVVLGATTAGLDHAWAEMRRIARPGSHFLLSFDRVPTAAWCAARLTGAKVSRRHPFVWGRLHA